MHQPLAVLFFSGIAAKQVRAEQRDSSWGHCWEHGLTAADCCVASSDCFDPVFTRSECCAGGWARLFPVAEPVKPSWEPAAKWGRESAARGDRSKTWLPRHPSLSRVQRRWEAEMANSSVVLAQEVLGVALRMRVFKRGGPAFGFVLGELQEDAYRLRQAAPPDPGAVVVDVGASVGMVAVLLAKLWPDARVVAVEPAPSNFRYLLWNIRSNGVTSQVWPLNIAIGAVPSVSQSFFYSPTWPTWSQACGRDFAIAVEVEGEASWRGGWNDWQVRFEVEAVTLAHLLTSLNLEDVHLLKVDCEGCEWRLFSAPAWPLIKQRVAHVTAELHLWALESTPEDRRIQESVRQLLCQHETGGHLNEDNIVCSTA